MRDLVILGGSSHPQLAQEIAQRLGISLGKVTLGKFSNRETSVQVMESVRDMHVFILQTSHHNPSNEVGGHSVMSANDYLMELLILIGACKMASARRITVIIPSFPYARQPDAPYKPRPSNRIPTPIGNTLSAGSGESSGSAFQTPVKPSTNLEGLGSSPIKSPESPSASAGSSSTPVQQPLSKLTISQNSLKKPYSPHQPNNHSNASMGLSARSGYKNWIARSGTLVANMLTASGAQHIITMDLHDPQFQGFFDIPVDNLYGAPLMIKYIREQVEGYKQAVIVSPDAGGAKRASSIARKLGCEFALIHKDRKFSHAHHSHSGAPGGHVQVSSARSTEDLGISSLSSASLPAMTPADVGFNMTLVGNVTGKKCILIDDIADTSHTITRAASLLHAHGATHITAVITHGILSADAPQRILSSHIDELAVSNTVPQDEHQKVLGSRLKVYDTAGLFSEAIRRIYNGESVSQLFG